MMAALDVRQGSALKATVGRQDSIEWLKMISKLT